MTKPENKPSAPYSANELVKLVLSKPEGQIKLTRDQTVSIAEYTEKLSDKCIHNLLAIDLGQGFEHFDECSSLKEFVAKRMKLKYSTVHHRLKAARVAFSIGGYDMVGKHPDDAMRAMDDLHVAQRREVYRYILSNQKEAKDVKVTIKMVKDAIKTLYPEKTDTPTKPKTKSPSEKQIKEFFGAMLIDSDNGILNFAKSIRANFTAEQRKKLIDKLEDLDLSALDKEAA